MPRPAGHRAAHRRLPSLDAVRGVAILMVVLHHCQEDGGRPGGALLQAWQAGVSGLWSGVDLFFALSGFLITRILIAARGRPRYFSTFYARRTLRIFPLVYGLYLVLFVALPLAAQVAPPLERVTQHPDYQALAGRQAWLWTYTNNFLQAEGPRALPGFGHFWSLAVEEQFYLLWPLVVWLTPRAALAPVCLLTAAAMAAGRAAALHAGAEPWAVYHWTFTHADGLLLGGAAAAALASRGGRRWVARWGPALAVVAATAVLSVGFARLGLHYDDPVIQLAAFPAFASLYASLVAWLALRDLAQGSPDPRPGAVARVLSTLGKHSYAMYVFHWAFAYAALRLTDRYPTTDAGAIAASLARFAVVTAAAFALAWLSWHAWEKHWLGLKRAFPYATPGAAAARCGPPPPRG